MLKVGLIGCGEIFNLNIQGYIFSPDVEVVAVSDTNVKNAREKLERWGLRTTKFYSDYKQMIYKENLDLVDILTPHHLHAPMTEYVAKAGVRGISVQKPMAHTITDCERMIQTCKEQGLILNSFSSFNLSLATTTLATFPGSGLPLIAWLLP